MTKKNAYKISYQCYIFFKSYYLAYNKFLVSKNKIYRIGKKKQTWDSKFTTKQMKIVEIFSHTTKLKERINILFITS